MYICTSEWKSKEGTVSFPLFIYIMAEEKIADWLSAKFAEPDFSDCFLVDIKIAPGNKWEVYVDCDSGLTLEKCQKISRFLEKWIDEQGLLGEKYVLEVSSPGIERPLAFARQYAKNVGRELAVELKEGGKIEGKLAAVEPSGILLTTNEKIKENNKTVKKMINHTIPFEKIAKAIVKVSF